MSGLDAFASVITTGAATFGAVLVVFSFLRQRKRSFYEPRTYLLDVKHPPPHVDSSFFGWIFAVLRLTEDEIIKTAGLDAFVLTRLLRSCFRFFLVLAFFGFAVLIPVYATADGGLKEFELISLANVTNLSSRLWAPVVITWFFSLYFYVAMYKNYKEITYKCQTFEREISPGQFTVLVTNIPETHRSNERLKEFFEEFFPGQIYTYVLYCMYVVVFCVCCFDVIFFVFVCFLVSPPPHILSSTYFFLSISLFDWL